MTTSTLTLIQIFDHRAKDHSQKELTHWAVDVTVEFYACLFSSSLMCNL